MLILLLIITLANFKIINGVENDDTQFINSLPEKQKKEFLQKVEKRIQNEVPEVKSPELNDKNVDVYEKRLEDQGKTIQNILRSEIDSLKTHNRRNVNDTERRQESHIDLTLRTQKEKSEATRRKNEGNGKVNNSVSYENKNQGGDNTNIPVVVQYDSENVIKHDSNTSIKIQNNVAKPPIDESKVDEITWENISFTTKSVNVNDTSTELKRTGRRSDYFDTALKTFDNATVGKTDDNASLSLDSKDNTTMTTTKPTSHDVDSGEPTKYAFSLITKLNSDSSDTLNVTERTTQDNINTMTAKITGSSSTPNFSNFDEKGSTSTIKSLHVMSGVVIDTTAQHSENSPKRNELSSSTQFYSNSETNNLSTVTDAVNVAANDLDSRSTISGRLSTTTNMVDSSNTNDSTTVKSFTVKTNKIDSSTQISSVEIETIKDDHTTTADPKNLNFDMHSKGDSERQPKYVPVYNYDPENAYYNANSQRPNANEKEKIPGIIKIKETHSTTTNLDLYSNQNKKSLRIKDIKERVISNDNMQQNSNLYDIMLNDGSADSLDDDNIFEKPLKHSLKKMRTKLYENSQNDKPTDDINKNSINSETNHEDDESINMHEKKSITELFTNFGTLLQNLVDQANNNEKQSSKKKKESDEDIRESDRDIYKDITQSLETHNKVLKNTGINKIIEAIENIQNKLANNKHGNNKIGKKEYQSRFQIKDRNGKKKQKQERTSTSLEKSYIKKYKKIKNVVAKFEKSATKINDDYLELHINILKDLVDRNDEGLEKYDWLGTTVLIRAGIEKLREISENKIQHEEINDKDQKLLDFTMELHEKAKELTENQEHEQHLPSRRKQKVSFRIPKPKKGKKINMLNRMYGELKKARTTRSRHGVEDFKEFLDCLRTCLDDLHTAIKQVSIITTYKNQRWFKNLKQLYLIPASEKEYMEVLLHLVSARVIGLLDERMKKMDPEDDLMKDRAAVERIEVEFIMVLRICNKLMELNP